MLGKFYRESSKHQPVSEAILNHQWSSFRGVESFPILVRPKFFRRHLEGPGACSPGNFSNIALRLAEIAFPRDIFRNICFHTADLFQNILNCGGVEKAYLSTQEEKYLQTCR